MNNISLIGRMGQDPELKDVGSTSLATFSLAVKNPYKADQTNWFNCVVWGKQAETLEKFAKKGDMLGLQGSVEFETYKTKEGDNRTSTKVNVQGFTFLPKSKDEAPSKVSQVQDSNEDDDEFDFD